MAVTFSLADDVAYTLVREAMRAHCPRLAEAGVEVGVIFASSDKEDVPALRRKGATVAATMQVVSLKDRVLKEVDAQMVINKQVWDDLSPAKRLALCHHELLHIDLKEWTYTPVPDADGGPRKAMDAKGELVTVTELTFERDDLGRPLLKSVHGDIDIGDAFFECVAVHGPDALEYESLTRGGRWADGGLEQHWERLRQKAKGLAAARAAEPEEEEADDEPDGPGIGPDSPFADAEVTYTNEAGEVVTRRADFTKLKDLHAGREVA